MGTELWPPACVASTARFLANPMIQQPFERLAEVVRHNLWDLLSLAALLPALGQAYRKPDAAGAHAAGVARAWAAAGEPVRAIEVLSADRDALDDAGRAQLAALRRRVARLRRTQEDPLGR